MNSQLDLKSTRKETSIDTKESSLKIAVTEDFQFRDQGSAVQIKHFCKEEKINDGVIFNDVNGNHDHDGPTEAEATTKPNPPVESSPASTEVLNLQNSFINVQSHLKPISQTVMPLNDTDLNENETTKNNSITEDECVRYDPMTNDEIEAMAERIWEKFSKGLAIKENTEIEAQPP